MARKKETADEAHYRMMREIGDRKEKERQERIDRYEAAWADLKAAIDRGEISREEVLAGMSAGPVEAEPIRLTIGSTTLEVNLTASIREVPAEPAQAPKPAEVIAFRKKRAAGK